MVVCVLLIAGLQLPLMPSFDVVGSVKVPPLQIAAIASKVGVSFGLTLTSKVCVLAH